MQMSGTGSPALLFENIQGYPGHRLLTNGLGSHARIAIGLDLDPATSFEGIMAAVKDRMTHPKAPVVSASNSVRTCVFTGNSVDLQQFPVPWLHEQDGGRYIGTWHLNVTRDPENGLRNVGVYRMQLLTARTTAISVSPGSHLAVHLQKAQKKGEALKMAAVIGVDETLVMAAAASPRYGIDEYDTAGGLSQEPVLLSPCRTIDLDVPASAEIVLEGEIAPGSRIVEGPFLDYAGVPKTDPNAHVFEVSCVTHRINPVFRAAAIGIPGGEDHLLFSILAAAGCLDFHGSRLRQKIQNALLKKNAFRSFQYVGRLRQLLGKQP